MAEIRQSARVKALQEEDKAVLERAIQESLVGTLPKDDSKSDSKDQVKPDAPPLQPAQTPAPLSATSASLSSSSSSSTVSNTAGALSDAVIRAQFGQLSEQIQSLAASQRALVAALSGKLLSPTAADREIASNVDALPNPRVTTSSADSGLDVVRQLGMAIGPVSKAERKAASRSRVVSPSARAQAASPTPRVSTAADLAPKLVDPVVSPSDVKHVDDLSAQPSTVSGATPIHQQPRARQLLDFVSGQHAESLTAALKDISFRDVQTKKDILSLARVFDDMVADGLQPGCDSLERQARNIAALYESGRANYSPEAAKLVRATISGEGLPPSVLGVSETLSMLRTISAQLSLSARINRDANVAFPLSQRIVRQFGPNQPLANTTPFRAPFRGGRGRGYRGPAQFSSPVAPSSASASTSTPAGASRSPAGASGNA